MASVLLFHHALGRTEGIMAFAGRLESAGHRVAVPDLFDGRVFSSIDDGVAHAQSIGFDQIIERGAAAAAEVTGSFVVAGFSLGVMPAQALAQAGRDPVIGAILYHGVVSPEAFGSPWPTGMPLQIHIAPDDPWAEEDVVVARSLADSLGAVLFEYPGTGHLIADSGSDDHDPAAAELIIERTLNFIGGIPRRSASTA